MMNILRRRYAELGLGTSIGVKGEFKLWTETESGIVREQLSFPNMILAGGMARLQTSDTPARISVGTGTAVEEYNQTSLQNLLYTTTDRQENQWGYGSIPDYHAYARVVYRIASQANSYTVTEVGFGPTEDLFSRALIRDANGDPTSISVLAGEFLYVQYILRVFHNQPPVVGTMNVKGTEHTYTMVPCGLSEGTMSMSNLFPLINPESSGNTTRIGLLPDGPLPATPLDSVSRSGELNASIESWYQTISGHSAAWGGRSSPGTPYVAYRLQSKMLGGRSLTTAYKHIAVAFDPPIEIGELEAFYSDWEASYVAL